MTDQIGSVLPFSPAGMSDQNGMSMPLSAASITAPEHLADARLHLTRACLAIKAASRAEPTLVLPLGTPHAQLVEVLARIDRIAPKELT